MAATYIYINDSSNNTWQIGVSDSGILQSQSVSQQSPPAIYLNDYASNTTSWLLTVTTSGIIGTQQVTYNAAYPTGQGLISPGGYAFNFRVDSNGILGTVSFPAEEEYSLMWRMQPPEMMATVWQ
jgi:predicted secreted protein